MVGPTSQLQTSQPQKTKNLEIKVKIPGDLGKNLEIYWQQQKKLKPGVGNTYRGHKIENGSLRICLTGYVPFHSAFNFIFADEYSSFPAIWQHGQNVSRCDKLVTITLLGICLLNMVLRSISCQQEDQIRQIFLRNVDFYRIDAWKSIWQSKNENYMRCIPLACESVYCEILCLIVRPWDCPQNNESHRKTVRLERSIYTTTCIVLQYAF